MAIAAILISFFFGFILGFFVCAVVEDSPMNGEPD